MSRHSYRTHFHMFQRSELPVKRVWWCPTGFFTLLPIHAAGIYDSEMGGLDNTSNYMISSYTPTLNTLLAFPPPPSANPFKMLVAIQPETRGYSSLPSTRDEMRKIEARVSPSCLVKLGPSSVQEVLDCLSDVSIAHFACHGIQDEDNPLDSALLFNDGPLKVSRIMTQPLPNASLAFLSACQTATGDLEFPNEAFHLAATMLFSGFRGVVATMW